MKRLCVVLLITLACVCLGALDSFAAANRFSILNFRPAPDGGEYFSTLSTTSLYQLQWTAGTIADFSIRSLDEKRTERKIIDKLLVQNFFAAIGITDWLSIGVDMPIVWLNQFRDPDTAGAALKYKKFERGDVRFQFKATVLDRAKFPVGVAIVPYGTAPTGTKSHFLGNDGFTGGGIVVVDTEFKRRLWLSLNAGAEMHKAIAFRNINQNKLSILLGMGASVRAGDNVMIAIEGFTRTPSNKVFKDKDLTPAEVVAGVKWNIGKSGFQINAGGGMGVIRGVSAPLARGFVGMTYRRTNERTIALDEERVRYKYATLEDKAAREVREIIVLREKCPKDPADFRQGVDDEACPKYYELREIADLVIKCPSRPEDFNPLKHSENCQKAYALADKYSAADISTVYMMSTVELSGRCPVNPADFNPRVHDQACQKYYELKDVSSLIAACPADPNNFNPKVNDASCPKMYELKDAYQEEQWMAMAKMAKEDADNDKTPDFMDRCPNIFGTKKFDGCPSPSSLVSVVGGEISTKVPITFNFSSYEITDESFKALGEVAEMLIANPSIKSVRIEGYADIVGPKAKSKIYSQRRAEAVKRYLELHGVDASRMNVEWHGPTKLFGDRPPPNRRVLFMIDRP